MKHWIAAALVLLGLPSAVLADPPQRAPMVATFVGPAKVRPGQQLTVVLHLALTRALDLPLAVTWTVPQGAKLMQPKVLPLRLQPKRGKVVDLKVRFSLTGVPADDLLVAVDVNGGDFGVHATAAYRFGRPEPKLPNPMDKAAPVKLRGKGFGTGVPIQ